MVGGGGGAEVKMRHVTLFTYTVKTKNIQEKEYVNKATRG